MKNKQKSKQRTVQLLNKNTDTIYSVVLSGINEIEEFESIGFNLPESKKYFEDELSKENVYESIVLLDLENGLVKSPSILSIIHSGLPNDDTIQDLVMRSSGEVVKDGNLSFLTTEKNIIISIVKSNKIGMNIYSYYPNYLEYVKSSHLGLMNTPDFELIHSFQYLKSTYEGIMCSDFTI